MEGRINDAGVVEQIAAKVADAPYTQNRPVQDQNADGKLTHRDAYLQDYKQYIAPKLEPQAFINGSASPADPKHPDNALLLKIHGCVQELDKKTGKIWDENSEHLSASLLVMSKQKGFTANDDLQVALNKPTEKYPAGELVHLARTGPHASPDPAANRADMPMADALSVPVEQRYQQVETIGLAQAEQLRLAQQQQLNRGPDDPAQGGPKFTM